MTRFPRSSGILLHPSSLPGPYGIGDIGPASLAFLDCLAEARQGLWQVLPLTPTGYGSSPYAAPSALAGNSLLLSPERLQQDGLLEEEELFDLSNLPAGWVDFKRLEPVKREVLRRAWRRFQQSAEPVDRLRAFRVAEKAWLEDFALFMALHEEQQTAWTEWEHGYRERVPDALEEARGRLGEEIDLHVFCQFQFFEQWGEVRRRAHERGVRIVGDLPMFVAADSADVWANRHLFKLDARGRPAVVAGVPPDYFSQTGQLWGNPLYDWESMAADGYAWWVQRIRQLMRLVDIVRIDHFRGFQAAWEVRAGAATAVEGEWVEGGGEPLFRAVDAALREPVPIIAEDLGLITEEVRALLARLGYPGMKVFQFAFGGGPDHPYLPHAFESPHCVVYTGTHDNDTTRGWYALTDPSEADFARRYLGTDGTDIAWDLTRLALQSVADTAIIPMQDLLDLGGTARMNVPGAAEGNWTWRAAPDALSIGASWMARLGELTLVYGRARSHADDHRLAKFRTGS